MAELGTCRSCGAEIVWSEHVATKRRAPLQADPHGTFVILPLAGYRTAEPEDRRMNRKTYSNHYASCPDAAKWRSRAGGRGR